MVIGDNEVEKIGESGYKQIKPLDLREAEIETTMPYEIYKAEGGLWNGIDAYSPKNPKHFTESSERGSYGEATHFVVKFTDAQFKTRTTGVDMSPVTVKFKRVFVDKKGKLYDCKVTVHIPKMSMENLWQIKSQYKNQKCINYVLFSVGDSFINTTNQLYTRAYANGLTLDDIYASTTVESSKASIWTARPGKVVCKNSGKEYKDVRYYTVEFLDSETGELSSISQPFFFSGLEGDGESYLLVSGYDKNITVMETPSKKLVFEDDGVIRSNKDKKTTFMWDNGFFSTTSGKVEFAALNTWADTFSFPMQYTFNSKTIGNGKIIDEFTKKDVSNIEQYDSEQAIPHKWDKKLNIKADKGWRIKSIKVNGVDKKFSNSREYQLALSKVTENQKVVVELEKITKGELKINKVR